MNQQNRKTAFELFTFFFRIGCFTFGAGTHKRRTGGTGSGGEVDSRDYDLQHRSVIRMPDVRMDRRCGGHAWDHMPGGADPVRSCIRI